MRIIFPLTFGLISCLQAQEVARPANAVALATSGQFVISTRNTAPPGQKAQPEVYEVITGKDGSAAVTLGALGSVKMEADTQIRMSPAGSPQSLELLKGKLYLNIDAAELKKNQNTEFRLKTPAALLAVKGTQFFLETGAGREVVGVYEGTVAVATLGVRSTAMLQKGQASSHGAAQPVSPRAMTAEELAQGSLYATTLPAKTPAVTLVVNGTSSVAEHLQDGDLTTTSLDDREAISKLGASVAIHLDPPASGQLKLTSDGVAHFFPAKANASAPLLRLKLVLRQPGESKAAALRFYLRGSPDHVTSVNGRAITSTASPRAQKGQAALWNDCLLSLQQGGAEQTFMVEMTRTSAKKGAKDNQALLELSDFTLLTAPVP